MASLVNTQQRVWMAPLQMTTSVSVRQDTLVLTVIQSQVREHLNIYPLKQTMEKIIELTFWKTCIYLGFILLNWLCNRFISIFCQCSKDKLLSSGRFFVLNKHVVLDNGYLRISDDQIYENLIWLSYSNGHSYGQFWRRFYYVDDAWLNRGRF